ncbi:MAG: serine/threonine-protein kinase [Nocardioidaceae bacterium]
MPTQQTPVLGDRYALKEVIGRGGMADVYRAEDQLLEREIAVKVMRPSADSNQERFQSEMRTLAGLDHPHLVTVLDAGFSEQGPYLVMELVEGTSLARHRGEQMDPEMVASLGRDLADALAYVHRRGIVHRDIKPGNILLDPTGRVRLTDFGISRVLADAARHTATGTTIGTAAYLAPEQVRGDPVSPAADIYALGLVLLEALTGQRIYEGAPMEAALARLHRPPEVPTTLPAAWHEVIAAMTAMEPEDRATAFEVTQRLNALASGEADLVTTAPRPAPAARPLAGPAPVARRPGRGKRAARQPRARRGRGVRAAVVAAVSVAVLGAAALAFTAGQNSGSDLPSGVPAQLQQPLQQLHDAVDGG